MNNTTMIIKHRWGSNNKPTFEQKCDHMIRQGYTMKYKWVSDLIGGMHEAHFIKKTGEYQQ